MLVHRLGLLLTAAVTVLVLAACGSSKPGSGGSTNPTIQALSYFPTTSPFVLTVATNPSATAIKQLQQQNPSYTLAATAFFAQLSKLGIDYNKDIRPLFGNPLAAGLVSTSGLGADAASNFLVAWVAKDAAKLQAVLGKLHLTRTGSHDGATLYSAGTAAVANDGPTLMLARSSAVLDAALDRHAQHHGFDAAAYAKATTGIPRNGLITAFGDLTPLLSTPKAAKARLVPWVAAITGYGASMTSGAHGAAIRFHIATTGKPLSVSQLPIASGTSSPGIAGTLPIGLGIRDPAQMITFIADAIQQTDPAKYAKYGQQVAALKRRSGVDVAALAKTLTGQLSLESDTHTTIARAQLSDPSAMRAGLTKLVKAKATKGTRVTALGPGLYSVHPDRKTTLTIGVLDNQLLVGRATVAQLRAFARAPVSNASAATGSVTFRIALPSLIAATLKRAPSLLAQRLISMLGVMTGSAEARTSGLTGTVTIPVK